MRLAPLVPPMQPVHPRKKNILWGHGHMVSSISTYLMFLCTAMILTLLANGQYLLLKMRNIPGVARGRGSPEKKRKPENVDGH